MYKVTIEDGKTAVYLNGKKLDEPYVNKYPLIPTVTSLKLNASSWKSYDKNYSVIVINHFII